MTAKDGKYGIDVGEEAIQRLAGQVFGAPKDRTKAKKSVEDKVNGKKKKQQQQQQQGQNDVEKKDKEKNKSITYAQKYHDADLLAEAIIIGRMPCFAVATSKVGNPDEVSITLQDSIPIDDHTVLKPFDISTLSTSHIHSSRSKSLLNLYGRQKKRTLIVSIKR
jgi:hypothetical protein